jgi:hypothetical protein
VSPNAFAFLTAAALTACAPSLRAQEAADWAEGYFQLLLEGIPDRPTIVALVEEGRVLVPLQPIVFLTEIPVHYDGATRILEWPPDVWRTELDPRSRTVTVGDDRLVAQEGEWVEKDGDLFLSSRLLRRVLNAEVRVDMAALTISVTGGPDYPRRVRAEASRRRALEQAQARFFDPERYVGVPYPARTGGFAAGWSVSVSESASRTTGIARPTLGAGLLGGSLEVGFTSYFGEGRPTHTDDVLARYQRVFPENDRIRQINVGTILSSGVVALPIVGAAVSNEPWTTPRYFDQAVVAPPVPAGWEYEVYQGNRLVGVSTADAPAEVTAPLMYGNTPLSVRMVGPAGQERVEELVYVVPASQVPDGKTRYSLGGGKCDTPNCDAYSFAEIGRGLTGRLTVYAGADYLKQAEDDHFRPYARIGLAATRSLHLGLQARSTSFFRADVQHHRGRKSTLRASYSWTRPSSELPGTIGWLGQASGSVSTGGRWLHARLYLRGLTADHLDQWQAAVSTNFRLTNVELGAESLLARRKLLTTRVQHALLHHLPPALRSVSLSAGLGFSSYGVDLVELGSSIQTARRLLVDARLRAQRGYDPMLSVGISVPSPFGFFRGQGTTGRETSYLFMADGGALIDPGQGVMPLVYQGIGQAGVSGEVFFDLDGDHEWGPDEPAAEGVSVDVGGWSATTDSEGRFSAWQLVPYEGATVTLDSLSVDPEWAPAETDLLIRPSPNLLTRVSIPLQRTRELIGSVLDAPGANAVPGSSGSPLAGAGIEVVELLTGEVVLEDRTFSDGVFYATRLRPGLYRVRLASGTVAALGLAAPPELAFEIPEEPGPPIELAPLVIPPR